MRSMLHVISVICYVIHICIYTWYYKDLLLFIPSRLHGTVGMVSDEHAVYVTCYFCYMLFNTHLCLHMILLWTGGETEDTVLHTVKGVGGLGIRMLTIDTKRLCTPRIGGLQVPMVLEHDYTEKYHIHTTHIHATYIQNVDTLTHDVSPANWPH